MTPGQVVTIAGAKGGVGKTTTSINLASCLGEEGLETLVLELDLGMANLVDFLSLPDADRPTLHEVLAGDADVKSAIQQLDGGVSVLPSGTDLDGYAGADLDQLSNTVDTVRELFDVIVVDTGAGLSRAVVEPLREADCVMIVTTPRVAALRDADKTKSLADRVDTDVCGFLLTKSGTGESPGPDRIADFMGVDLLGHVPDDDAVPASQDLGVPVIQHAPDSDASETYRRVTEQLLDKLPADTGDGTVREPRAEPRNLEDEHPSSAQADGGPNARASGRYSSDDTDERLIAQGSGSRERTEVDSHLRDPNPRPETVSAPQAQSPGGNEDQSVSTEEPTSAGNPFVHRIRHFIRRLGGD